MVTLHAQTTPRATGRQKRINQWNHWATEVIPSLLPLFRAHLRETSNMRLPVVVEDASGERQGCFEKITLRTCKCSTAPCQLMAMGLFSCAPLAPSLAVDLRVLQFVRTLFVRQTPNATAWCEALEVFLAERGHTLKSKDSLRRHFNNAYHWYCILVMQNDDHVSEIINAARLVKSSVRDQQPLAYLRTRSPLCFGASDWQKSRTEQQMVDCIVCIDACFTQKQSKNPARTEGYDPPNPSQSFFLPPDFIMKMEAHVEQCRSRGKEHDDILEEGMRVPVSVLDGCGESFKAADEKREKASTQFFTDTGLMALLCHHDHVLWLANMTTAEEKQYYALVLIQQLIDHIPDTMRVGLLYNIGCQLEHSLCKWKFFNHQLLSRFQFAISVFHAYGHQWPCQVVYHPRCKCLWSALKPLIAPLRVSGFHQGVFVLDMQVRHLNAKSLSAFSIWLSRRWAHCQAKKQAAIAGLRSCNIEEGHLRNQWVSQVEHQMKPSPKQSKTKVKEEIGSILELEKLVNACQATIQQLEIQLISNRVDDYPSFQLEMADARAQHGKLSESLRRHRSALGVEEKPNLKKLRQNQYLQVRMNALAVKTRIRDRLRHRKAYRQTIGDSREPTLIRLVSTYNTLCGILSALIRQCKAVHGAVAPHPIPRDKLYELDVDDDIWQDVGLVDGDGDAVGCPPPWLADEDVRVGIRYLLERDRCQEEEDRVARERCHLQEWLNAEWDAIVLAQSNYLEGDDHDMVYKLDLRKEELRQLGMTWKAQIQSIHAAWPMSTSWGPDIDIAAEVQDGLGEQLVDEDEDWESDNEDREDDELLDALEEFGLLDEYRVSNLTDNDEQEGLWNSMMAGEDVLEGGVEDMYLLSSSPLRPGMW
ncbi:hypothetical protein BU15DRAFT_88926 [Melanogaster broomeanus]|nr:hypothetical protein BU15DRAFT_88926 [Melanogaster broomeanus]